MMKKEKKLTICVPEKYLENFTKERLKTIELFVNTFFIGLDIANDIHVYTSHENGGAITHKKDNVIYFDLRTHTFILLRDGIRMDIGIKRYGLTGDPPTGVTENIFTDHKRSTLRVYINNPKEDYKDLVFSVYVNRQGVSVTAREVLEFYNKLYSG